MKWDFLTSSHLLPCLTFVALNLFSDLFCQKMDKFEPLQVAMPLLSRANQQEVFTVDVKCITNAWLIPEDVVFWLIFSFPALPFT